MSTAARPAWQRPSLSRSRPDRRATTFYRTAESGDDHGGGGIPLGRANDVVVAAVGLAYDVAQAQIERSERLARRLRDAGDRATGGDSAATATDAADSLMTKALLSGLEWWETSVAQGRCPTTRLFAAEYRLLGTMLGFGAEPAKPPPPVPGAVPAPIPMPAVVIVHLDAPAQRRAISVERLLLAGPVSAEIYFFHREQPDLDSWPARLEPGADGRVRLALATASRPAGGWRAAICDGDGVQLGMVEIAL